MMKKFLLKIINSGAMYLAKHRGDILVEKLVSQFDAFSRKVNNVNFDMRNNGELRVLNILSEYNFNLLFDVGANAGQYSSLLRKLFPRARIHAFEIVPSTYNKLCANINKIPNIVTVNLGLGDCEEFIKIHIGKGTATATAFKIDGIFNISSHDLLVDFCKYFNANGFIVGKIYPKHVVFFDYHFNYENFHGGNFLAVKSNETEMITKLRG